GDDDRPNRLVKLQQQPLLVVFLDRDQPDSPGEHRRTVGQKIEVGHHEGEGRNHDGGQPPQQRGGGAGEAHGLVGDGGRDRPQLVPQFLLELRFVGDRVSGH
ncbi:MAG: hypothetical protein ACK56F_29640, partial [bacterium]